MKSPLTYFNSRKFYKCELLKDLENFKKGEIVWCKIDKESDFSNSKNRLRVYSIWVVNDELNEVELISYIEAEESLSFKNERLSSNKLNKALNLVKSKALHCRNNKIRKAVFIIFILICIF